MLTDRARFHDVWKSTKPARTTINPHFNQEGGLGKAAIAIDPPWVRAPQLGQVSFTDADRKEENGDCQLDWPEVRANEGLTKFFHVIRFLPLKRRREAHDVSCKADQIIREQLPIGVMTRSALLVTGKAPKSLQRMSTGKGAPVEMCQHFEKARIVHLKHDPCFILNRCRPRVLTTRLRVEALAKKKPLISRGRAGRRPARENAAQGSLFAQKSRRDGYAAQKNIALAAGIMTFPP